MPNDPFSGDQTESFLAVAAGSRTSEIGSSGPNRNSLGKNIERPLRHDTNGHSRNLNWRYLPYIRPIFEAYVREYPHKIWPYMVQYHHFRILKFPLMTWYAYVGSIASIKTRITHNECICVFASHMAIIPVHLISRLQHLFTSTYIKPVWQSPATCCPPGRFRSKASNQTWSQLPSLRLHPPISRDGTIGFVLEQKQIKKHWFIYQFLVINLWLSLGYLFIPIFRHPHKRSQIQNCCINVSQPLARQFGHVWSCTTNPVFSAPMRGTQSGESEMKMTIYNWICTCCTCPLDFQHSGCWSQHLWIVIGLLKGFLGVLPSTIGGPKRSFGKTCSTLRLEPQD